MKSKYAGVVTKIYLIMNLISTWGFVTAQDLCKPVGWATLNGGVTGGGNASPVVVTNYNDFKSELSSSSSKVIHVSGVITIPSGGMITVQDQSGKTVIGLSGSKLVSNDQTKNGSGILQMKRCKNFILCNLVFEGPGAYDTDGYDNFCIDNCQNIWVDHCEFHDGMDGNFDIKNQSDFISVTWCTFSYEKPPKSGGSGGSNDHRYSNLIGSSDNATDDNGKLNVTFYYCWWGEGCRERMPRIRFGKVHMANNLFTSTVSNHCIRAGIKANILAEGNYFDNQKKPIDEGDGNYTAIKASGNHGLNDFTKNSAFTPSYSISVAKASDIVSPIKSCAGARLTTTGGCSSCGGDVNQIPTVKITASLSNAAFDAPASININVNATDGDGTISKVEFYNGTTLIGSDNSSPYSFLWTDVAFGTYSITAKATDNGGATATSLPVVVIVNNPNVPSLVVTGDTTQVVDSGNALSQIVFTWGGASTDVNYTELPEGLTAIKNSSLKTLTVSGNSVVSGTFSVTTVGGNPAVTKKISVSVKKHSTVLANWYPFQEDPIALEFISFTNASIDTGYYDQTKPANDVNYTPGALRLNKGSGLMKLSLGSLDALKIRFYATGGRSLKVTYGVTGTENTWNSSSEYGSGAHEIDLTSTIPELISQTPVTVIVINDRADGGTLNIHDLYVEGTEVATKTEDHFVSVVKNRNIIKIVNSGNALVFHAGNLTSLNPKETFYILNLLGKVVKTGEVSNTIDISGLERGAYLLKVCNFSSLFIKRK